MTLRTVKGVGVKNKKILLRVDFNLAIDRKTGKILDDFRIRKTLPTIKYLLNHGAKIIICGHLGQPQKEHIQSKKELVKRFSFRLIHKRAQELIGNKLIFVEDWMSDKVKKTVQESKWSDIILLENLRFHKEEEQNTPSFSRKLASLADIYVNDAFGASHRNHASTAGVAHYLPSFAGFLLAEEISVLSKILEKPARPLIAIIGGVKIEDKIETIENLLKISYRVLLGGALANTFLKAQDAVDIGSSVYNKEKINKARELLKKFSAKIILPIDFKFGRLSKEEQILDIGPKTIAKFKEEIDKAKMIVWNGPLGYYEDKRFAKGTEGIARLIAKSRAYTVVGGGDSIAVLERARLVEKVDFVSTGGGAMLEFLAGKKLPGIEYLVKN